MYKITENNVIVFGDVDDNAIIQIHNCQRDTRAHKLAVMADAHKGYGVPIGGVIAYKNAISPSGVGYDIGCGNLCVLTDMVTSDIKNRIPQIMKDVQKHISFGIGRPNNEKVDHR